MIVAIDLRAVYAVSSRFGLASSLLQGILGAIRKFCWALTYFKAWNGRDRVGEQRGAYARAILYAAATIFLAGSAASAPVSISIPPHLQVKQPNGAYAPAHLTPDELDKPGMVCIRFNNFWCVKDAHWQGEIGKDTRGHAQFDNPVSGARAFAVLMHTYRFTHNLKSADQIISRYAPSTDCVGSIGKPPNCPYGINPVKEYSTRVARAVGKAAAADLELFKSDGKIDTKIAIPLFQTFSGFELTEKYRPDEELIISGIHAAGLD